MRCVTEYDKKVIIGRMHGTADAHGHVDTTSPNNWTEYTTSYAAVQSKGGREFWRVDQVNADVSHVWMCPYSATLATVTTDMRLTHEGVVYEILSVVDKDLAHEEFEIRNEGANYRR